MTESQGKEHEERNEATPAGSETGGKPSVQADDVPEEPKEIGGPKGPEPTRFGDWERAGRCIDF